MVNFLRLRAIAGILFVVGVNTASVDASVFYTFSESSGGLRIDYTGSLDTSMLSAQGGLSSDRRYITIEPGAAKVIDLANFQPSPALPDLPGVGLQLLAEGVQVSLDLEPLPQHCSATSAAGDTFGFYTWEYGSGGSYRALIFVPYDYLSGAPIDGGMFFEGETFESMGLRGTGFKLSLPGGEVISATVVPEPGCATLILGMCGIVWVCRRKAVVGFEV